MCRGSAGLITVGRQRAVGTFSTHNVTEPKFFLMWGLPPPERVTDKHMGYKVRKQHGETGVVDGGAHL